LNPTNKIENLIQGFDLEFFLTQNKHLDGETFLLRDKSSINFLKGLLANQLNLYPKAKNKLPTFYQNHCWFSPKSFEQCSSEATALHKSGLYSGKNLLDLSGGLGSDDWAFSKTFEQIFSLDPDESLNILVRENFKKLGVLNINRIDADAETYLEQNANLNFDLIYLDADRRNQDGKDYSLEGGNPAYPELEKQLLNIGRKILLKLSPMADLSYLCKNISHLKQLSVIGYKSEVKEILAEIEPNYFGEIKVVAHVLDQTETFLMWPDEKVIIEPKITNDLYFFESHNALVKSNLSKDYLCAKGIETWGVSGIFGMARFEPIDFMGRVFLVIKTMPYHKSEMKSYFKTLGIKQANFTKRQFPTQIEILRKTFGIAEGGSDYFFLTTMEDGSLEVCHCIKNT
jgi:hypothetical protein